MRSRAQSQKPQADGPQDFFEVNMTQNTTRPASVATLFTEYVATNIIGQMGMSAYILVDTFFISIAGGSTGMTALNLVLPFYDLIFAFGDMFAVGSATRFTIGRARGEEDADRYFTNACSSAPSLHRSSFAFSARMQPSAQWAFRIHGSSCCSRRSS